MTENRHINANKITIQELEDKDLEGIELTAKEAKALQLFREIKLNTLQEIQQREDTFHSKYEYFRELSGLLDYQDFLTKMKYDC